MRIFPFLSKAPKYKRFHFEPRYYDAAQEEREQRHAQIRHEVMREQQREQDGEMSAGTSGRLQKGYLRSTGSTRRGATPDRSSMTRLILVVLMTGSFWAWIQYGEWGLYIGGAAFALYIFLRIRRG